MSTPERLRAELRDGAYDPALSRLYPARTLDSARERYRALLGAFLADSPDHETLGFYSAPGRTELGGNHTDHNHGKVLAAAVTLDALAVAAPAPDISIRSAGYPDVHVDIGDLERRAEEEHTSAAVVRGVAARMRELGHVVGGFHARVHSTVPEGSGLSSSASFEVLVATILNSLYNHGSLAAIRCAQIGQYAENVYFGKPSGLMDQTTSAVGGVVAIDFRDVDNPVVHPVRHDPLGMSLVVVNTGGSHAGLTAEYAAIRSEMESVARALGGTTLRDVDPELLQTQMGRLRGRVGDRALLRALHYFGENKRVEEQVRALEQGDRTRYLSLVRDSGRSSWTLNQNCYSVSLPSEQPIPLALALSDELLRGRGAARVHGGGFAGTIQAYVPDDLLPRYLSTLRGVFGDESCVVLDFRADGAIQVGPAA
jgi:galactokinase